MTGPAPITVRILADSINEGGDRLTTFEWTYPRMIHAEVLTHAMLRRNSASSRAIPASVLRRRTHFNPAYPGSWGANQKGMQADSEVADVTAAERWWLDGLDMMAAHHAAGEALGLHKQVVNRVIEPWMMITIIISATDWSNFFHLRNHAAAEPSFQKLARLAWEVYHENLPAELAFGQWHLPLVTPLGDGADDGGDDDLMMACLVDDHRELIRPDETVCEYKRRLWVKVSTGRCARVSYLTHDGKRDIVEDIALHDRLLAGAATGDPMHMSPFEHPCVASAPGQRVGPFTGWTQYRKLVIGEAGPTTHDKCRRCGCWGGRHVATCPKRSTP